MSRIFMLWNKFFSESRGVGEMLVSFRFLCMKCANSENVENCTVRFNGWNALGQGKFHGIISSKPLSCLVRRENCSRNSCDCKIFPSWHYRLAFARLSPVVGWQPRKSTGKLFSSFHVRYLRGVLWHLKHSVPSRHSKKIERKKNESAQVFVLLPVFPICCACCLFSSFRLTCGWTSGCGVQS